MLCWYKLVIISFILRREEKVTPSHVLPKPGSTVLQRQKAVLILYCNSTRRGNEANIWNFYPSLLALACAKRLHNVLNLPAPQWREQVFPRPTSTSQRANQPVSQPATTCVYRQLSVCTHHYVRLGTAERVCVYVFVCLFVWTHFCSYCLQRRLSYVRFVCFSSNLVNINQPWDRKRNAAEKGNKDKLMLRTLWNDAFG